MLALPVSALIIWFFAHLFSPIGTQISISRSFCTVALFFTIILFCCVFGGPVIGWLWIPAAFLFCILVTRGMLSLSFTRSLLLVLVYLSVVGGVEYGISRYEGHAKGKGRIEKFLTPAKEFSVEKLNYF